MMVIVLLSEVRRGWVLELEGIEVRGSSGRERRGECPGLMQVVLVGELVSHA